MTTRSLSLYIRSSLRVCFRDVFYLFFFFLEERRERKRETDVDKIWKWGNIKKGKIFSIVRFRRFRGKMEGSPRDRVSRTDS